MDVKKGEVFVVEQNYEQLTKGNRIKILEVYPETKTVDVLIIDKPELWLSNIPINILQNDF